MKILRVMPVLALTLALALLSASCGFGLGIMDYDKATNLFTDRHTGVSYTDAPSTYEPTALGREYARWKSPGGRVVFYEIEGMDPSLWLAEEGKTVFYSTEATLPALPQMEPNRILICVEQTLTIAIAEIIDPGEIRILVDIWETGEAIPYPSTVPKATYRIKFVSQLYPGLLYSLIYIEYDNGDRLLYSRDNGRCVYAGDILHSYIGGD
ncbi:MAG TPA: hypothetical protein GX011_08190 [Clostridiales bacterium]|jgi:hypothetical protein|nr:hypothetical protein [Clostridiales bacterium]